MSKIQMYKNGPETSDWAPNYNLRILISQIFYGLKNGEIKSHTKYSWFTVTADSES